MDFVCKTCGYDMRKLDSEGYYHQLVQMYKDLYMSKSQSEEFQMEVLKRKNNLLGTGVRCSSCGSIFREYICNRNHICTILSICPICGETPNNEC